MTRFYLIAVRMERFPQPRLSPGKEALRAVREPLGTVWPVVAEAMYLLAFCWKGQSALWEMIEGELVSLLSLDAADAPRMKALMHEYRDPPMDFADAAIVRVAEREKLRRIFTVDRRDFQLYRPLGVRRFTLIP